MKYAQGDVSLEFKSLLKAKLTAVKTDAELEMVLNEIHDATLECRNSRDGLKAAVKLLKE